MKAADRSGGKALLTDDASLTAVYLNVLEHLMDKGELPASFKEIEEKGFEKYRK
jgi:hypothetical protein